MTQITSYQVLLTLTFRKSRRGTLMPFVAASLKWAQGINDDLCFILLKMEIRIKS